MCSRACETRQEPEKGGRHPRRRREPRQPKSVSLDEILYCCTIPARFCYSRLSCCRVGALATSFMRLATVRLAENEHQKCDGGNVPGGLSHLLNENSQSQYHQEASFPTWRTNISLPSTDCPQAVLPAGLVTPTTTVANMSSNARGLETAHTLETALAQFV